ncbi:PH domain-containing protein [Kordiimonas sp. SCSIO 12603]|uniref:PH domain-containing protein n=1 Tax=Kordiimonas sp. SCSIO 12603 TaxID=2829596 RepID=UPI00210765EC|nr:PH domain-containing protein [Kordiimonas sp. SCSIO 12603]UTW58121.1 PH domain-containing protein [Kordiimonas sp. SCSIO 12603]
MSDTVFENNVVLENTVPPVEELDFAPLASTYARTLIIESSIFFTILAIIPAVINWFVADGWLLTQWWFYVLWLLLTLSPFIWAPMVAKSRGFSMREKDIHYRSGLIWKKTVSLPYNRIQHVEIESGPLERIFKLTTLKFFTAGGAMSDMKIPALEFERSSKLRAFVMEKAGVSEAEAKDAN